MPEWLRMILTLLLIVAGSAAIAGVIVFAVNTANADKIQACVDMGGELLRGYRCELPSGLIVNPLKWEG